MTATEIVERARRMGIVLSVGDGVILARPKGATPPDLADAIRANKAALLRLLAPDSGESIPPLPIDLSRIADAIARNPRSPFLSDLAIATFTRAAIGAQRVIDNLPEGIKAEARYKCRGIEHRIIAAIAGSNYQTAYELADALIRLPDELAELALR